jgi:hypothetical protein
MNGVRLNALAKTLTNALLSIESLLFAELNAVAK